MSNIIILDLSLMPSIFVEVELGKSLFFSLKLCSSSSELLKEISSCFEKQLNKELLKVYVCKGPGSYTGLKLAQIISEVLGLVQIRIIEYTHFDLLNEVFENGFLFYTYAYKNEFFFRDETKNNCLLKKEDLVNAFNSKNIITKVAGKRSDLEHVKDVNVDYILEDIYSDPNKINNFISNFKSSSKLDLLYFREEQLDFIPSILK